LTFLYKNWALKKSVLDIPNDRSSHFVPTPHGGGFAIVITFYSGLFLLFLTGNIDRSLFFALIPGIVLAFVGFIDDLKNLPHSTRFTIQFLCSGIALFFLGGFHGFFGDTLLWLWSVFAMFGIVWFINLFNFLDGSDGVASMEAISISLALWFFTDMNFMLLVTFSVGGFLYWNWPKARIFMGDVGSTTLGFILVVLGIYLHNNGTLNFFYWILITALFWFDATITLLRRIINKENLSQAHKNHLYQRAIQGGFSHLKTLLLGLGINILLFLICIAIWERYISFLSGLCLAIIILWSAMKYVDRIFGYKKPQV
jgi:Fuc2NAc and GlcNAc transferase